MGERDDVDHAEAEAQREQTVMPWVWGALGLILIAGFVVWVLAAAPHGHVTPNPPAAAPLLKPPGQGY
jgi:hypothetical protein